MAHVLDAIIQLKDNFSSTIKTVEKNVGSFSRTAKRMGRDIQRVGKDLTSFGDNMTKKVTLPTIALGAASLKMAMDFDDAMAKVSTIADTTVMSLSEIRQELLRVSDATGIAVTDLAEAQYSAISAGVDTAKSIEFLETATKTSRAGFADMDTTIDALTTTLNAYGLETEKAMNISNQMLLAQDFGKTTVQEMGASLGNVIPIAASLNVSTEELFASMAALTKSGIKTSEAVTGLKGAYSNILKPSSQASKLAESLGLNFNAAHLQSVGWAKFLEEVKEKTGGNTEQMAQLFGSVQGLNSVMVLTGKGSKDFNNVLGQMGDVAGLTDEKFEQLLTPAQKLKIEFNKLKNTGIEFGAELIPLVTQFTGYLGQLTDRIKNLTPEQRQMIIRFAGMAAVAGPVIGMIGRMTTGVGKLVLEFGFFAGRIKKLGLIGAIFTPGVKVVLIIGAIIAAVILLIKNWDKVKAKVNEVFPNMQQTISTSIKHIKNIFWGLSRVLTIVMLPVQLAFFTAWEIIKNVFVVAVETIGGVISGLLQALSGIIDFVVNVFTGNWAGAWQAVQDIFGGIFKGLVSLAKAPLNLIIGLINGVIGGLNKVKLPKWVPKIGGKGISIPLIPKLAKGTSNWQGGIVQVHERGGEIIDLPKGSRVYPHDKSVQMAREQGRKESQTQTIAQRLIPVEIPNIKDQVQKVVQELKTVSIPNIKDITQTIKQRLIPANIKEPIPLEQPIKQQLVPVDIPSPSDMLQTIKQQLVPANIPSLPEVIQSVRQKLDGANMPDVSDIAQTVKQSLIPANIPKVSDVVQTIKQQLTPTTVPNIADIVQNVKQRLIPADMPNVSDVIQIVKQKLEGVDIPDIGDVVQNIVQRLIPVKMPSINDKIQNIRQKATLVDIPDIQDVTQNIKRNFTSAEIPDVKDMVQNIAQVLIPVETTNVPNIIQNVIQKLKEVQIPGISDRVQSIKQVIIPANTETLKPLYQEVVQEPTPVVSREERGSDKTISIAKLADTIVVREDADIDKIANAIVRKIEKASLNMA